MSRQAPANPTPAFMRASGAQSGASGADPEESAWGFAEGDRISPQLTAIELLGGGYRYEAYLAWDDRLRSLVVVKLIRPGLVDDEASLRGLRREVETLDALDHPVIIRAFDAELEGERPFVALEHAEGPRLSSLLRRYGTLQADQLLQLGLQLLSAAHYMAAEGFVHLDIKPSNIIMSGPPRLIDMSLARTTESAAALDEAVGTDDYMAPEQCAPEGDRGELGPAADVWGIAATLYKALIGELPYPSGDADAPDGPLRWPQLRERALPMPPSLPESLTEPVMSALDPRPENRPAAGELADQLEPLLEQMSSLKIARLKPRLKT